MRRWLILGLLVSASWAQEIKRPTVDVDGGATGLGCIGSNYASVSMPLSYDASGLSTSSDETGSGTLALNRYVTRIFKTWQTTGNSYSALTLNVNSLSAGNSGDAAVKAVVAYSSDAGATWTNIRSDGGAGWFQTTNTVTLSPSQNLSQLRVGICIQGNKGGSGLAPGSDDIEIFDIWTSGTISTPGPPAGTGNTAGAASRRVTFVF